MKKAEYIKYIILYILSFFLRPFFSVNSNLMLFSARGGRGYEGNTKYLYLYASKFSDSTCVWITKDMEIYTSLLKEGHKCAYYFSWEALKLCLQAQYVFITHSLSDVMPVFYKKQTRVINLWHGIPLKNIEFLDQNMSLKQKFNNSIKSKRTNVFISNSEYFSSIYEKCFRLNRNQIKVIGYPRMEFLKYPEKFQKKSINPFIGDKVYLYAPTFRDYKMSQVIDQHTLEELNKIMIEKNAQFYIKLHPFDKRNTNVSSYSNINLLDTNIDIQESLTYVDFLITDYSSIFLDFLVLDKPILLYCYDLEEYERTRGFLVDFETIFDQLIVRNSTDFLKRIKIDNFDFSKKDFVINSKVNDSCENILKEIRKEA